MSPLFGGFIVAGALAILGAVHPGFQMPHSFVMIGAALAGFGAGLGAMFTNTESARAVRIAGIAFG